MRQAHVSVVARIAKRVLAFVLPFMAVSLLVSSVSAQDLGPQVRKLTEGVYVYVGENLNSNCGIILTDEGVVLIDSGHTPTDSRKIAEIVKKLTSLPIRLLLDTEPHPDHTTGHFVFSPPAVIVAAAGAGDSMRARERQQPDRIQTLAAVSPEMKSALDGYKFIPPNIEYNDKITLNLGQRTFEMFYLKGVHSEADSAIWMPKERVLFSASGIVVEQINIFRPNVSIADILDASKRLKALNPAYVVPGHGIPGTVKIFDDSEKFYALLLERVGAAMKSGKTLDEIRREVKMPEYAHWASQDRFPTNIDAAYRLLSQKQ